MTTTTEQLNGLCLTEEEQRAADAFGLFARVYPVRVDPEPRDPSVCLSRFPKAVSVVPAGFRLSELAGGMYASNVNAETLVAMGLVPADLVRREHVDRFMIEQDWLPIWRRWYPGKDFYNTVVLVGFFQTTQRATGYRRPFKVNEYPALRPDVRNA